MIQNSDNKPLSELFSADNKVRYHIPKYQREYVWSKWNWESLFDDISESKGGHFLGSIICINTEKDSHKPSDLELVDGQQRMTTISLFYLALYKRLKECITDLTEIKKQVELATLRNRIIIEDENLVRLSPSYSNSNLADYKWIFADFIEEISSATRPKNLGNRRMHKAFNYLYNRLAEVDDSEQPIYSYSETKNLIKKLNSATLVKIDVANHADAFTLFETLNNRGVPLSAIDLIKNKLLGQLEKVDKKEDSLDKNFERWNQIISNLTDEYKAQERFLRQFYNAFRTEDKISVEKTPKALRSNLIRIYEDLIDKDVHYMFDRLEKASQIYSKHIQYDIDEHPKELITSLRNLENVNGADGYMLLLYVSKKYDITADQKINLVDLLCKYFIRRNVTDSPPTRDLTNHFMDIIEEIGKLDTYDFERIKSIILDKGKPSSDTLFEEKLNGDLYDENVGATRFILSSIEAANSNTKERYTNFYTRNKKLFIWTVEHIFPQGENIPTHWVDMVANGDNVLASKIRKEWVHKLGNLTLTGYNSKLSNMSLDKKQDRKDKEQQYIGFKNGLWLNKGVKEVESWGKTEIKNRTQELVGFAMDIFSF